MKNTWDRMLWGVEFSSPRSTSYLIGRLWLASWSSQYRGEPAQALLFTTRKLAREWCAMKMAEYSGRDGPVSEWNFRPVRVREVVSVVRRKA